MHVGKDEALGRPTAPECRLISCTVVRVKIGEWQEEINNNQCQQIKICFKLFTEK